MGAVAALEDSGGPRGLGGEAGVGTSASGAWLVDGMVEGSSIGSGVALAFFFPLPLAARS
jgi:hypothetical protein